MANVNLEISIDRENRKSDLLRILLNLYQELHHQQPPPIPLNLDSSIHKDLDFDSLTRVELYIRIEQHFQVGLPESSLDRIETPRDILRLMENALPLLETKREIVQPVAQDQFAETEAFQAETLLDVLDWHLRVHPQRTHVRLFRDDTDDDLITYEQLYEGASKVAAGLQSLALTTEEPVAIMLPTGRDYFFSFFGILLCGGIPVPIYPPQRLSQLQDHLVRQTAILDGCQARIMITFKEAKVFAHFLKSHTKYLKRILTAAELSETGNILQRPAITAKHTAFLQYTSGSTGIPKGVVLSHANLLANIRSMGKAVHAVNSDVFISWLPLYHDMGLIGAWFGSMYYSMLLVIMSPLAFLSRPQRWLWAIHRYQGTMSAAPNFAFEFCVTRIPAEEISGLDLSSWRIAFNGAEPVSTLTLKRFSERYIDYGFRETSLLPVYGLAENSVGLSFPPLQRGPKVDYVDKALFSKFGKAAAVDEESSNKLGFVSCGQAIPGHEMRIVNSKGRELPEREQGLLQFKGPSATSGYYRNPVGTHALFQGEWLNSDDLAYIANGEIYVTGRKKDIIIRGGRNIFPDTLEEQIGKLEGIRKGCVAVFGSKDRQSQTERLIILAETKEKDKEIRHSLIQTIDRLAKDILEMPAEEIILAPPHSVLKTSSGKIRRSACKQLYEQGLLTKRKGVLSPIRHIFWSLAKSNIRRLQNRITTLVYNAYVWTMVIILAPILFLISWLPGSIRLRWKFTRSILSLLRWITNTKIKVTGLENLPVDQPYIIIANHASYMDAFVIIWALVNPVIFTAKSEFKKYWFILYSLVKMGVVFLERDDALASGKSMEIFRNLLKLNQILLFFPEGTFSRVPGLLPFHLGAFLTAATNNVPIVPVSIRGTRNILRADSWFIHHGAIKVHLGESIYPKPNMKENKWDSAVDLRDRTRPEILKYCGEPDLIQ